MAGEYAPASDIFSLGVVMLELLTGAPPPPLAALLCGPARLRR